MDTDDKLMTTTDVADLLQVPAETVKRWRAMRKGPPALLIGRHVRYTRAAVLKWAAEQSYRVGAA